MEVDEEIIKELLEFVKDFENDYQQRNEYKVVRKIGYIKRTLEGLLSDEELIPESKLPD